MPAVATDSGGVASGDARDDPALLRATADGDVSGLEALYRRHAPWLVTRLARRCDDAALVDEVVQDTFVAVWRGAGRWRGDGEVGAWIWGIAVRRLIDALRRRPDAVPVARPAQERTMEHELDAVQHGELATALARLSPELRSVVQATVLDGLTTKEAATLLGIPTGTVKTRMMRARAQLREAIA